MTTQEIVLANLLLFTGMWACLYPADALTQHLNRRRCIRRRLGIG